MRLKRYLVSLLILVASNSLIAQQSAPMKIAVFAPIYLDTVFNGSNYILGNNNLPRTILPGLDFYNGVQLAIDSLNAEGQSLTVLFFDSKSNSQSIKQILATEALQDISMIIASFNNRNDVKTIADFALNKQIPLISMTYPNDGGVKDNPYFALVNPTLTTHVEGVFKFLQKNYPTEPIIYVKKSGGLEDMIEGLFLELNKKTPALPLKIRTISVTDSTNIAAFNTIMDSTKTNIIFCGSLNENFGINLVKSAAANKTYKSILVGMPTWDAIKDLGKGTEIIYSTPYNYNRTDKLAQYINQNYRNKVAGRPSDMVFKGFEAMYHFGKLLIKHQNSIATQLSDNSFKLFNEFDFVPVKNNGENLPAYLENKRIYFIKKTDGVIKSIQ
ncbi:ABC transporter substrate-binding protein [Sediminibacterium sp.]|uniref:ABC transporter substrate-binding protein n=1 Tax=Sediminibacterium sp. TaxID=1917865 RepID=UPI0027347F2E|nr:ABC transporter substrate-binding protein [Sediminibacterium sp.]MDP3392626.1 ABC transporter substrate-binding protein [Sediminibacterium sp.]MDP3566131.1 ABC transporter substrate-binding protein [Sediminibacterium sp.]